MKRLPTMEEILDVTVTVVLCRHGRPRRRRRTASARLVGFGWHPDGERMAKVKRHDFGIAWGNTTAHKRLRVL